ncbi:uncharacterized protein LOC131251009 isoform X2 [Magnolia sinica]|nr:uncharacterized protein LOC131251009 isoform X2 [Magnolia sinica]
MILACGGSCVPHNHSHNTYQSDEEFRRESNDCIVPRKPNTAAMLREDGRFSSPDEWLQWGVTAAESFRLPNNCSTKVAKPTMEEFDFDRQILSIESNHVPSIHESESSVNYSACGDFSFVDYSTPNSDNSSQNGQGFSNAWPDYQLQNMCESIDGLGGMLMDDIFLDSLLKEDARDVEYPHQPACVVLDSEWSLMSSENLFSDMIVDSQRTVKGSSRTDGSKHLQESSFSLPTGNLSDDQDGKEDHPPSCFVPDYSEGTESLPTIKAPSIAVLNPTQLKKSGDAASDVDEESMEATVLQELVDVMRQMNQNTRIGFRDAFYRLAKDLKQRHESNERSAEFIMDEPSSATITMKY